MIIVGLICLFVAIYGVATGGGNVIAPALVFAGIGVWLIYRKATEKTRIEKIKKKKEEEALKKAEIEWNNTIRFSQSRFSSSRFATFIIQEFSIRNWEDLNFKNNGCQVLEDKIETPNKTYLYDTYGLNNLDLKGCKELAAYIGEAYGKNYKVVAITRCYGGYTGGYSGYIGSDGSVSVSRDYSGVERTIGYKVYSELSAQKPKREDW